MKKRILLASSLLVIAISIALAIILNVPINKKYLKSIEDVNIDNIMLKAYGGLSEDDVLYNTSVITSHAGVVAEYVGFDNDKICWKFKNIEVAYGKAPDENIFVRYDDLGVEGASFETGKKYFLLLTRDDTVFYDTAIYNSYYVYLPLENLDECKTKYGKIILENDADASDLVTYISHLAETKGYDYYHTYKEYNIFRNQSLKTVVENSDCIFKIKVNSLINELDSKGYHIYSCDVTDALRGEYDEHAINGGILYFSFPDSLEIGKEYIVMSCLFYESTFDGKKCRCNYMLAADNGIIPLEDEKLTEEFYKYYK